MPISGNETSPNKAVLTYPWPRLIAGSIALIAIGLLATSGGSVSIPPIYVIKIIAAKILVSSIDITWPPSWDTIIWQLRLPRIILAALVGSALAISGATYQGLFRNPLADPYLIGVASGAGLGATIVLVSGSPHSFHGINLLPIAAFFGGLSTVTVAYFISRGSMGLPLSSLILAGVAIASMTGAATTLLMIRSDPDLRPILSWLLGSFISAQWNHDFIIILYLIPCVLVILAHSRILNVLQLDEEHSKQLGVNVERTKLVLVGAASLATATAVSFSGLIGFVGLIAPHSVRLIWGADYRTLIPMSAIGGAGFLIVADLVARTVASPSELPVGVVTAFCGTPFFLYLLRRRGRMTM